MNFPGLYLKEVNCLKCYIFLCLSAIILSYSVYLVLDVETVARLGSEDHLFEWMTAISFLVASIIFIRLYFKKKNFFYILFALVFFFGFGEEISWGQRIIGFSTPASIEMLNVQDEFNLHNLEPLNTENMYGGAKSGLSRLLEVNFLFKVFTIIISLIVPIAVFHINAFSKLTRLLRIPVPPASLAVLFALNWIVFRLILDYVALSGKIFQYYDTATEIFEFISAFIILMITIFFYNSRNKIAPGEDVKEYIVARAGM
jgi:hypothetical protein